ncbi:MAG: ATP phosphoribosyltransferase regulatory subunit [Cyanobium sp. ELA712]
MALQPAAGARDLQPGAVESNRRINELLAGVYRLWGYQEVTPPTIERLTSLEAGGAINSGEILRLAADEPLGLRPELTAPIARAACSRMRGRPRPLRLWASGTTFRTSISDGGGQRIHEELQSGVELLGEGSSAADAELLQLLLAAVATLGLEEAHRPTLLVGHHGLLDALLSQVPAEQRGSIRRALTGFDPLALEQLNLPAPQRESFRTLLALRGEPERVLYQLEQWLGPIPLLQTLADTLTAVAPAAAARGVRLQLDPSFQPHFDLYDGLVFRLVCQGHDAPVAIASGGRYDALVGRFGADLDQAAGTGFGFAIEAIRELLEAGEPPAPQGAWLVAAAPGVDLAQALSHQARLHQRGEAAELCLSRCASEAEAETIAAERGCRGTVWVTS